MNIYMIWQSERRGYDTFDSAVVVAENEDEARRIHPSHFFEIGSEWWRTDIGSRDSWVRSPEDVKVQLIGNADKAFDKPQVIVASFNPG